MLVVQLIKHLLDPPQNNNVYVSGSNREWKGILEEISGSGIPGVRATYLTFNETGLNVHISKDKEEPPFQPEWLTTYMAHRDCVECHSCAGQAVIKADKFGSVRHLYQNVTSDGVSHEASVRRNEL